jgi:catechol 2,3-dioxygenase-like lactoylglutathione lyase family enzyme
MLRGFATINYWTDDMEAATRWYAQLLGIQPYFERPGPDGRLAYAEFRLGDYQAELGLVDRRFAPEGAATEPGGVITYWHVDNVSATFERRQGVPADHPPRGPGVRDGCGDRPVRERAGHHVQPALPGDPAVVREGVTARRWHFTSWVPRPRGEKGGLDQRQRVVSCMRFGDLG